MGTTAVTASGQTGLSIVYAWSFTETAVTPAPAHVRLRAGGASGTVLVEVKLAAGEDAHMSYTNPLTFHDGAYLEVVAGTVTGMVDGTA